MSDYMFMLESHLNPDQNRAVSELQAAAETAGLNLFLTGGAMRDMLGGYGIRDLDFTVEGNALKLARAVSHKSGARLAGEDDIRKVAELVFPSGVTASIGMSRVESYARTGARPVVAPAYIDEYLRGRDFSINAIALSLNRASRGLLRDPANGIADLERREMRALGTYTFYDDPSRMLRLVRLRVRLGFAVEERTRNHYENARATGLQKHIPPRALFEEVRRIASEPEPAEVLRALQDDGLLELFSPALASGKLQFQSIAKFERAARTLTGEGRIKVDPLGTFLYALTDRLSPKEKAALIKALDMKGSETSAWQKLEGRARKLETAMKSPRLKKPSLVYQALVKAPADEILFLLYQSQNKLVLERIRNYLQKYLPAVQEIAPAEFEALPGKAGTPKYEKEKEAFVANRLDRRPRKVEPPPPPPPEPVAARGQRSR